MQGSMCRKSRALVGYRIGQVGAEELQVTEVSDRG